MIIEHLSPKVYVLPQVERDIEKRIHIRPFCLFLSHLTARHSTKTKTVSLLPKSEPFVIKQKFDFLVEGITFDRTA